MVNFDDMFAELRTRYLRAAELAIAGSAIAILRHSRPPNLWPSQNLRGNTVLSLLCILVAVPEFAEIRAILPPFSTLNHPSSPAPLPSGSTGSCSADSAISALAVDRGT